MHTACGLKAMWIAPLELRDICGHDLFQRAAHRVADEHEVPQDIAQLIPKPLLVNRMTLEDMFFDQVDYLSRFTCQTKRSQRQFAERILSPRVGA